MRVEETYDPAALTLELDAPDAVAERSGALPQAVRAALSAPAEAERAVEGLAALDELEAGLAALRPSQRQLLYMTVVQGWPSSELAALCGVSAADAVRQRLRLARAALRRGRG